MPRHLELRTTVTKTQQSNKSTSWVCNKRYLFSKVQREDSKLSSNRFLWQLPNPKSTWVISTQCNCCSKQVQVNRQWRSHRFNSRSQPFNRLSNQAQLSKKKLKFQPNSLQRQAARYHPQTRCSWIRTAGQQEETLDSILMQDQGSNSSAQMLTQEWWKRKPQPAESHQFNSQAQTPLILFEWMTPFD